MNTPNLEEQLKALLPQPAVNAEVLAGITSEPASTPPQAAPNVLSKPKPPVTLSENNLQPADYSMRQWAVMAPRGVKPEDVLKPVYWRDVAHKFAYGDMLHIRSEDLSWYLNAMVLYAERGSAKIGQNTFSSFHDQVEDTSDHNELFVQWRGGKEQHCVVRRSTGVVIKGGFRTRVDGQYFIAEYLKDHS